MSYHTDVIAKAVQIALDYGQVDGAHHKAWVIDQMLRALEGDHYAQEIADYCRDGEYEWDVGVAP